MKRWSKYLFFLLCTIMLGTWLGVSCYSDENVQQPITDLCQIEDEVSFDVLNPIISIDIEGVCEITIPAPESRKVEYADYICPELVAGPTNVLPLRGPPSIG